MQVGNLTNTIYGQVQYQVSFDGLADYVFVTKNSKDTSVYSANGSQSIVVNQTLTQFGANSFEFYVSSSGASRTTVSTLTFLINRLFFCF